MTAAKPAADARKPDAETAKRFLRWIGFAMGVKAFMIEEGLRQHSEDCPFCEGGKVEAALAGSRDHLVLACTTGGSVRMRE